MDISHASIVGAVGLLLEESPAKLKPQSTDPALSVTLFVTHVVTEVEKVVAGGDPSTGLEVFTPVNDIAPACGSDGVASAKLIVITVEDGSPLGACAETIPLREPPLPELRSIVQARPPPETEVICAVEPKCPAQATMKPPVATAEPVVIVTELPPPLWPVPRFATSTAIAIYQYPMPVP